MTRILKEITSLSAAEWDQVRIGTIRNGRTSLPGALNQIIRKATGKPGNASQELQVNAMRMFLNMTEAEVWEVFHGAGIGPERRNMV